MGLFTKVIDPYNTMGAAQQARAERDSARKAKRAEKSRVESVARQYGLTLEAAKEMAAALDDIETYGGGGRRGLRAADFIYEVQNNPKNRKDWYR